MQTSTTVSWTSRWLETKFILNTCVHKLATLLILILKHKIETKNLPPVVHFLSKPMWITGWW